MDELVTLWEAEITFKRDGKQEKSVLSSGSIDQLCYALSSDMKRLGADLIKIKIITFQVDSQLNIISG